MVKRHVCPNCGSDDCDFVDVGLPNALTCIDCGTTFPYELTLFPKVIKTESNWPFPTSLVKKRVSDETPNTNGLSNAQEAPF